MLLISIGLIRRNHQQNLRADGLADQTLLPALDNLMLAAGIAEQIGVDCGIAIPGRIELLAIRKPTGVLDHHGVLVGQLGAVTLDQRLRDQPLMYVTYVPLPPQRRTMWKRSWPWLIST